MNRRLLRLVPIGGVLTAVSLAFAGSAAAGGGGFPPPGNYTFKDTGAFASYEIAPPGPITGGDSVFLSVDRGVQTFDRLIGAVDHHDRAVVVRVLNVHRLAGFLRREIARIGIEIVVV